ncbi:MAG: hypothetical protein ACK56F_10335 [bacterium]
MSTMYARLPRSCHRHRWSSRSVANRSMAFTTTSAGWPTPSARQTKPTNCSPDCATV